MARGLIDSRAETDEAFQTDFLLTYRYFASPQEVVSLLSSFFVEKGSDPEVQGRVISVLASLLDADPHLFAAVDSESVNALEQVLAFVDAAFRSRPERRVVEALRSLARSAIHAVPPAKEVVYSPLLESIPSSAPLQMVLETLAPSQPIPLDPERAEQMLLETDVAVVAAEMTLISFGLYSRIEPIECLHSTFSDEPERTPAFTAWTRFTNRMRAWVVSCILRPQKSKMRAKVYAKLLKLPLELLKLQNFNDALNIWIALDVTPAITRLKSLRESLPAGALSELSVCEVLFNPRKNNVQYLSALTRSTPPLVPVLSIFSSLLFKTDGAQPDVLPSGAINFRKLRLMGSVLRRHLAYQSSPYYLPHSPAVSKCLRAAPFIPEKEWYDISCKIEKPRRK